MDLFFRLPPEESAATLERGIVQMPTRKTETVPKSGGDTAAGGTLLPSGRQPPPAAKGSALNPQPLWGRIAFAAGMLLALVVLAAWTGHDEKLVKLYECLLHAIELLLGAFVGVLTGEGLNKKR